MVLESPPVAGRPRQYFYQIFLPFPIACFTLTLFTDVAYVRSGMLLWQDFSAWLLFAGLVFGGLGILAAIVDLITHGLMLRGGWMLAGGSILVLALALLNSLVHAGDGWTAVVPYGLILSALVVLVIAATYWACIALPRRYRPENYDV